MIRKILIMLSVLTIIMCIFNYAIAIDQTIYYKSGDTSTAYIDTNVDIAGQVDAGTATLTSGSITDSSGSISFDDENVTMKGNLTLGADDDISTLVIHDAGTITIYDDSDDTSVQIGPVTDGTTGLGITGELEINTTSSNSAESITITPQDVISTQGAEYDGVLIDAGALDPSEDDTFVHGIHIDMSGVVPSGNATRIDGIHIETPIIDPSDYHVCGIHLEGGMICQRYTVNSETVTEFRGYSMVLDASNLDSSSAIHGFSVELSGSNPSGTVAGFAIYSEIDPIHQHIQAFSTPSQTEYAGRYTGSFTDGIDTHEVFVAKNNEIWFGSTSTFDALEVTMSTGATRDCLCEFYYYNTGSSWIEFFPDDSTIGFQNSGLITFESSNFTNWDAAGDPAGADGSAGYWMAIKRTVNADPGTPTITTLKTGTSTLYYWDENGDLYLRDASFVGGDIILGTSSVQGTVAVHDAGTITMYDDGDNTNVVIGPVADGDTELGITGALQVSEDIETPYIRGVDDLDTALDLNTGDQFKLWAGGIGFLTGVEAATDYLLIGDGTSIYISTNTGDGALLSKTYNKSVADEGTFNLPSFTSACRGWISAGNAEAWADFIVDNDGDVTLIANTAGNVTAGGDVDGDLCIGTAATQEPLTIKNRLGGTKIILISIEYD